MMMHITDVFYHILSFCKKNENCIYCKCSLVCIKKISLCEVKLERLVFLFNSLWIFLLIVFTINVRDPKNVVHYLFSCNMKAKYAPLLYFIFSTLDAVQHRPYFILIFCYIMHMLPVIIVFNIYVMHLGCSLDLAAYFNLIFFFLLLIIFLYYIF